METADSYVEHADLYDLAAKHVHPLESFRNRVVIHEI
jgi:hypothetical protein